MSWPRPLIRSFAVSVLLHALVLGLFAFGVSRGFHASRQDVGRNWVEFGAEARPVVAQPKTRALQKTRPLPSKAQQVPVVSDAIVPEETTDQAVSSSSNQESRESAESRYVSELATLLNRNRQYPRESVLREQEGKVIVSVSLDRDGIVHEKVLDTPSPFRLLNEAAMETVSRVGRFPAPPAALLNVSALHGTGSLRLKIPISFRIERR